jgi:hypothetical protein
MPGSLVLLPSMSLLPEIATLQDSNSSLLQVSVFLCEFGKQGTRPEPAPTTHGGKYTTQTAAWSPASPGGEGRSGHARAESGAGRGGASVIARERESAWCKVPQRSAGFTPPAAQGHGEADIGARARGDGARDNPLRVASN